MRLTNQTNYAIRMLMYCNSKGAQCTVGEIAAFYQLPEKFLFKILQILTAHKYVKTVRGRGGGIRLALPAAEIRLGDLVRHTEENFALAECFEAGETNCPLIATCGLNQALGRALDAFISVLNEYTLADLTKRSHNINVLLKINQGTMAPYPA